MAERQTFTSDQLFTKVQLGIRMNKRVVKVLKATAEYMDMPFAALIESMAVTAFQGQCIFGPDVLKQIERFSEIYGLEDMLNALRDQGYDEEDELQDGAAERPRRK